MLGIQGIASMEKLTDNYINEMAQIEDRRKRLVAIKDGIIQLEELESFMRDTWACVSALRSILEKLYIS